MKQQNRQSLPRNFKGPYSFTNSHEYYCQQEFKLQAESVEFGSHEHGCPMTVTPRFLHNAKIDSQPRDKQFKTCIITYNEYFHPVSSVSPSLQAPKMTHPKNIGKMLDIFPFLVLNNNSDIKSDRKPTQNTAIKGFTQGFRFWQSNPEI